MDDAAAVDGAALVVLPVDALDFVALLLDFVDPPAAFFFGAAAFFFGLLALPADFGLAALDFGLAAIAFLAPVDAFFLLALAAGVVAAALAVVDGLLAAAVVVAAVVVLAVAGFFAGAFFVGDAERFRLLVPLDDFGLLDERAFFVVAPPVFLVPLGVFDRLRDLVEVVFFVVVDDFFLPADETFFAGAVEAATLKLPLAPIPLVCFIDLFFVPARNADLRC